MILKGWQCPRCCGVFSPTTSGCLNCTGRTYTSSGTSGPDIPNVITLPKQPEFTDINIYNKTNETYS